MEFGDVGCLWGKKNRKTRRKTLEARATFVEVERFRHCAISYPCRPSSGHVLHAVPSQIRHDKINKIIYLTSYTQSLETEVDEAV